MPHYQKVMLLKLGRGNEPAARTSVTSASFVINGETLMPSYKQQFEELQEKLTASVKLNIEYRKEIKTLEAEKEEMMEKLEIRREMHDELFDSHQSLVENIMNMNSKNDEMQNSNELSARVIRKLLNAMDKMEEDMA
jgi:predicted nuclease with TOPRIM domain